MSTKEEKIIEELKTSNKLTKVAFALAFIFMGLQFWPTEYNYGMKIGFSSIFFLAGVWLLFMIAVKLPDGGRSRTLVKIWRYIIGILTFVGIIAAIITYLINAF